MYLITFAFHIISFLCNRSDATNFIITQTLWCENLQQSSSSDKSPQSSFPSQTALFFTHLALIQGKNPETVSYLSLVSIHGGVESFLRLLCVIFYTNTHNNFPPFEETYFYGHPKPAV